MTYTGCRFFNYSFSQDISEPFVLNCDEKKISKKYYIKLELNEDIGFADAGTVEDYQNQKNKFISENQNRDSYYDFFGDGCIPGIIPYNLISIKNEEPPCIYFFLFLILTILSFAELYKIYINIFCINQEFTIKKIISTRFYLYPHTNKQKYLNKIQPINTTNKQSDFKHSKINQINERNGIDLPSKEEVENNYKKKVATYKQNDIEININNKELNKTSNLPPAILSGEEEKSSERLKQENNNIDVDINYNNQNSNNNDNNENDSVIFVNKQITFEKSNDNK